MNQAPWRVGNVSFGYIAANRDACGTCYQMKFPNGHIMFVKKSNIGDIKENAWADLMVPGGGVGDFDALTRQIQNSGISNPSMGVRYGGFRGQCGWSYSEANKKCVEDMCNAAFRNLPDLRAGCLWYTSTLGTNNANWDNPNVQYKQITCPAELNNRY
jgi:hypothetical protein